MENLTHGNFSRQFTREVKLAAVRRLEGGASIAEVSRAFEVNPNVLHRWRKEFREGPGNAFPGQALGAGMKPRSRNWSARSASKPWKSIF